MHSLLRSFLFFFSIFFLLEIAYRLSFGKWPLNTIEALVIVPVALVIAFILASTFNRYRMRESTKNSKIN